MARELKFGRKGPVSGKVGSMVVLVHGYGADGADLLGLADPLGPHLRDTVFYAPDAPEPCAGNPFGRQWFGIPRFDGTSAEQAQAGMLASAEDLNAFVDARLTDEGLTPNKLILLGFSQGSMMSLQIAPRRDVAIAGVVSISGRLLYPDTLAGEIRVKPPILLMHGDRDEVVPFQEMQTAGNAFISNGFDVYAHVMKGSGHGIAPDGLQVALSFMAERLAKD